MESADSPPEPAQVQPFDVDGVRTVGFGTILWALAFAALLPFKDRLDDAGRGWWIWTCVAGVGLGLLGVEYCRKRRDGLRIDAAETDELPPPPLAG